MVRFDFWIKGLPWSSDLKALGPRDFVIYHHSLKEAVVEAADDFDYADGVFEALVLDNAEHKYYHVTAHRPPWFLTSQEEVK